MTDVTSNQGARARHTQSGVQRGAIHWVQTLRHKRHQVLDESHLRFRWHNASGNALHCVILDCSGSMLGGQRLALAKGLLQAWSRQLYSERSKFCVIGFGGGQALLLQPPRKLARFNEDWIGAVMGGGGTSIVEGLHLAEQVLSQYRKSTPEAHVGVWLLTDGRFSCSPARPAGADDYTVVDFETAAVALQRARSLARQWQADYVHVDGLHVDELHWTISTQ